MQHTRLTVRTNGRGMLDITEFVRKVAAGASARQVRDGVVHLFLQHTSASLILFENADPTAKADMEAWLSRLVTDGDRLFTHRGEGDDDMSAHVRSVLTGTTLTVPFQRNQPMLGRWQGVYLWEHRTTPHERHIIASVWGEAVMGNA